MSHGYRTGDIVRHGDVWGVVRQHIVQQPMVVDWWVGQYSPHTHGEWVPSKNIPMDISAPFAVDYPNIPEEVIARSMQLILTE